MRTVLSPLNMDLLPQEFATLVVEAQELALHSSFDCGCPIFWSCLCPGFESLKAAVQGPGRCRSNSSSG